MDERLTMLKKKLLESVSTSDETNKQTNKQTYKHTYILHIMKDSFLKNGINEYWIIEDLWIDPQNKKQTKKE